MDMENCSSNGWSQEATSWAQCQAAVDKDGSFLVPWLPQSEIASFQFHSDPSATFSSWAVSGPFDGFEEDKAASASKSHSQAEKRRRDRINSQLATLRKLIPKSDKMDKAALLGSVIEHVKDLKSQALEVSKAFTVPTEIDEVTIIDCDSDKDSTSSTTSSNSNCKPKDNTFIKASVCCEDRPELFSELSHALQGLSLTTVRADMTCLGGRIKGIFILCSKDSHNSAKEGAGMNTIKQSLKVVLSRIATSSSASNYRIKSKRQRFFLPSHDSY